MHHVSRSDFRIRYALVSVLLSVPTSLLPGASLAGELLAGSVYGSVLLSVHSLLGGVVVGFTLSRRRRR